MDTKFLDQFFLEVGKFKTNFYVSIIPLVLFLNHQANLSLSQFAGFSMSGSIFTLFFIPCLMGPTYLCKKLNDASFFKSSVPECVESHCCVQHRWSHIGNDYSSAQLVALQLKCILQQQTELGLAVGDVHMGAGVQRGQGPVADTLLQTHQGFVDIFGLLESALVMELTVPGIL